MLQTGSLHADLGGMELDLDLSSGFDLFGPPSWSPLSMHMFLTTATSLSLFSFMASSYARSFISWAGIHCDQSATRKWSWEDALLLGPVSLNAGDGNLDLFGSKLGLWPSHSN